MFKLLFPKSKNKEIKIQEIKEKVKPKTSFIFLLDNLSETIREQNNEELLALKRCNVLNDVKFTQIQSRGALWSLGVLPGKLISLLELTVKISFREVKKNLFKKDIFFFKQLGKLSLCLEEVDFEDTNSFKHKVNKAHVITAATYLMRAQVHLGEMVDRSSNPESGLCISEETMKVKEEHFLLMYKLLRANGNLKYLTHHTLRIDSTSILRLFGSVCIKNRAHLRSLKFNAGSNPINSFLFR